MRGVSSIASEPATVMLGPPASPPRRFDPSPDRPTPANTHQPGHQRHQQTRHRLIYPPGTSDFDSDSHAHDPHAAIKEEESYNAWQHRRRNERDPKCLPAFPEPRRTIPFSRI